MNPSQTSLTSLIVEYHKLYHDYQRPEYREILKDLGASTPHTFEEEWMRKVNEGCERADLPKIYLTSG